MPALIASLTAGRIAASTTTASSSSSTCTAASPHFAYSSLPPLAHLHASSSSSSSGQSSSSSQRLLSHWNAIKQEDAAKRREGMNLLHDKLCSGLYAVIPASSSDGIVSFL